MENLLKYVQAQRAFLNLSSDLTVQEIAVYQKAYPETALLGFLNPFGKTTRHSKSQNDAINHANYHGNMYLYHKAHSILEGLQGNANESEHHQQLSDLHDKAAKHFTKASKSYQHNIPFTARHHLKKGYNTNNEIMQRHATYSIPKASVPHTNQAPKQKYSAFNNPQYNNPNFGTPKTEPAATSPQPNFKNSKFSAKPVNPAATPKPKKPVTPKTFSWQKPIKKIRPKNVKSIRAKPIKYKAPKRIKNTP